MGKLAVILPAYNEEQAIGKVIDDVRATLPEATIFVVNNACTDNTIGVALDKGALVISESRKGKGRAVRTALQHIIADYVFMLDADGTYPPISLKHMYELMNGRLKTYDAVYGKRRVISIAAMSRTHRVGNRILTCWARFLFGGDTQDLCSGMWGFKGCVAKCLGDELTSVGFTLEADIYSILMLNHYQIGMTRIFYCGRDGTKAKLRMGDGFKIAWFLLQKKIKGRASR